MSEYEKRSLRCPWCGAVWKTCNCIDNQNKPREEKHEQCCLYDLRAPTKQGEEKSDAEQVFDRNVAAIEKNEASMNHGIVYHPNESAEGWKNELKDTFKGSTRRVALEEAYDWTVALIEKEIAAAEARGNKRADELEAARHAYARELGCDVGDIHASIRRLKESRSSTLALVREWAEKNLPGGCDFGCRADLLSFLDSLDKNAT